MFHQMAIDLPNKLRAMLVYKHPPTLDRFFEQP